MEQITDPTTMLDQARKDTDTPESPLQTFDSPERAWSRLSLVALNHKCAARHGILTDPLDPRALPYERLRARLIHRMRAQSATRVGITGVQGPCNATSIAANLALSCANLPDFRTMLFDLDLRNPTLSTALDLERIGPRYSALTGTLRSFDSSTLRVGDGLALSLNATPQKDPTRLLASQATPALLSEVEQAFAPDLMIFLLPPLLPNPEALIGLSLVHSTLLVAQADQTTHRQLDRAERMVTEHGNCMGVLMSECRFGDDRDV